MITLNTAKSLTYQTIVHNDNMTQNQGNECQRWRVSGKPKTWKRSPERVQVPIKHGLYANDYITENTLDSLHLASDCTK